MQVVEATVLIVDDDPFVRRGISRLVRAAGYNAKAFSSPLDFLKHDLPPGPACVVLDMQMDQMSGIDVHHALQKVARKIPVVFLSGHGSIPLATAAIKQGAEEFLEKPIKPKELMAAIDLAIEHDKQHANGRQELQELQGRYNRLTLRERQVMQLVVNGSLNKQAAAELGITEKTIKVHRARVMEKMEVDSLALLARLSEHIPVNSACGDLEKE